MRLFAVALFFSMSIAANAAIEPSSTSIRIYRRGMNVQVVDLEKVQLTPIRSRPPHRQLNPEGKTFTYEGISVLNLLKLKRAEKQTQIHFIGRDGYVSTVPASVLLKANAILALKQEGQFLSEQAGGLQIIYSTEGSRSVEARYAQKAAFWCWYVRSIVIGNLENTLNGKNLKMLPQIQPIDFEAPLGFQFDRTPCPKTVRVPLSSVIHSKSAKLHFLSGETKVASVESNDLLLSNQNAAVPVSCGGPFAVTNRERANSSQPLLGRDADTGIVSIEATP